MILPQLFIDKLIKNVQNAFGHDAVSENLGNLLNETFKNVGFDNHDLYNFHKLILRNCKNLKISDNLKNSNIIFYEIGKTIVEVLKTETKDIEEDYILRNLTDSIFSKRLIEWLPEDKYQEIVNNMMAEYKRLQIQLMDKIGDAPLELKVKFIKREVDYVGSRMGEFYFYDGDKRLNERFVGNEQFYIEHLKSISNFLKNNLSKETLYQVRQEIVGEVKSLLKLDYSNSDKKKEIIKILSSMSLQALWEPENISSVLEIVKIKGSETKDIVSVKVAFDINKIQECCFQKQNDRNILKLKQNFLKFKGIETAFIKDVRFIPKEFNKGDAKPLSLMFKVDIANYNNFKDLMLDSIGEKVKNFPVQNERDVYDSDLVEGYRVMERFFTLSKAMGDRDKKEHKVINKI